MDNSPGERDRSESTAYDLRREFVKGNVFFRIVFILYLVLGAFGGLSGGYLLIHETRHWVPWAVALTIIEPVGIACCVSLLALIAPESVFATFLQGAIRRATIGVAIVGFTLFAFVVSTLSYVAWYFLVTAR